jgi:hypothetical protein
MNDFQKPYVLDRIIFNTYLLVQIEIGIGKIIKISMYKISIVEDLADFLNGGVKVTLLLGRPTLKLTHNTSEDFVFLF